MQQFFPFFLPDDILADHRHKLLQDFNGGHTGVWSSYDIGMLVDLIIRICWFLQISALALIDIVRVPFIPCLSACAHSLAGKHARHV